MGNWEETIHSNKNSVKILFLTWIHVSDKLLSKKKQKTQALWFIFYKKEMINMGLQMHRQRKKLGRMKAKLSTTFLCMTGLWMHFPSFP